MTYPYPKVEELNDNWYYWMDEWVGPKGPFDTEQQCRDAMQADEQTYHGH